MYNGQVAWTQYAPLGVVSAQGTGERPTGVTWPTGGKQMSWKELGPTPPTSFSPTSSPAPSQLPPVNPLRLQDLEGRSRFIISAWKPHDLLFPTTAPQVSEAVEDALRRGGRDSEKGGCSGPREPPQRLPHQSALGTCGLL